MRTFWIVLALHLIIIMIIGIQKKEIPHPPGKIEVHTVQLQKPKKPLAKVVEPARSVEPKPEPKKKPKSKTKKNHSSELKQLLQKSIAALDEKASTKLEEPKKMASLKSEALTFISYETLLVEYLKELLELPEQGEVKLKLTLTREGRVLACQVVEGSAKNRSYVDREIASLRLPAFESHFKGEKQHTFPITLKTY